MNPRERQASGGVTLAPRPAPLPARAGSPTPAAGREHLLWEDLYHNLPPEQQSALLALAARQGLLHAHQLPDPAALSQRRQLLSQLLTGKVPEFPPAPATPLDWVDTALDPAQREAVARAVHTPDVCLIQGLPGSGKSRVVAEIVTQATARGERVLLVAPHEAALDRV